MTNHTDTLPELLKNIPTDPPTPTSTSQPHGGEPKLFHTGSHPFSKHTPSSCLHPFRNPKAPQELSDPGGRAVSGLQSCFLRELWLERAEFGLESQECSLSKQQNPTYDGGLGGGGRSLLFSLTPPTPNYSWITRRTLLPILTRHTLF